MSNYIFFESIDSTNSEASRRLDEAFEKNGSFKSLDKTIFYSASQTAGRGRLGRTFFSPDAGLYMSLVYCPDSERKEFDPAVFTATAAVAVSRVVKKLYDKDTLIKWVNDVFLNGKKICGILTEGKIDRNRNQVSAIIVGIGVNLYTASEKFPPEVRDKAGSILDSSEKADIHILCKEIAEETVRIYEDEKLVKSAMKEYRERSNLIGKKITVTPVIEKEEGRYEAFVKDITESARLVVQLSDGSIKELSSGEVSLHI